MTGKFLFSTIAKYLAVSVLICFSTENLFAQKNSSKNKDKDNEKKKEYPMKVNIWKLDEDYSVKEYSLEADTALHLFQNYDYNDKSSISYSNLGNMGSPYIYNIFDDREQNRQSPVFFFNQINDFVSKPEDTKFYQVNHPYTWLYYATTPKSRNGQVIDFTHTQNVTKKFNWGFNIGLVGSTGRISHQNTRNTTINPQFSYIGKHLSIHFFYNFTKSSIEENGGIDDNIEVNAKRFTTIMSDPYSEWGRRTWNLVTEYSLGKTDFKIINDSTKYEIYTPRITFGYRFQYDKMFRSYTDDEMSTTVYKNFYLSDYTTYDSLFYHRLTNEFHLKIAENQLLGMSPGLKGTIGMENELYYNFKDYITSNEGVTKGNAFFEGGITKNKSKNLILNGTYRQYLSGYKSGDMHVKGDLGLKFYYKAKSTDSLEVTQNPQPGPTQTNGTTHPGGPNGPHNPNGPSGPTNSPAQKENEEPKKVEPEIKYYLKASIDFYNQEPTYFEKYYYSNNYIWNNNFDKSQTTRIGVEFGIPKWKLKLSASHYLLNNYVYFNSDAVPAQYNGAISVQSVSLMKDFFVWHLRFANRLTYQNTNQNKILNLPKFAVYHATYLEFYLVKNVLLTQLGGEVHWSTEYNAFGYAPSTSVFYPLADRTAGNYPLLNGFANIKIHGVLMFFKWENIGNGLIRDWYYSTSDYPYQDFHFMFGILWRFGD